MTFQIKATERYFPAVVLFFMLKKVVLTVDSAVVETLQCDNSNQKATQQYFHLVLFVLGFFLEF